LCRNFGINGCRVQITKPVSGIAMGLITDKNQVNSLYFLIF
jgi:polyribonucleotide nucleotidyltransferase